MKNILFNEQGMRICFRVNDDRTVELVDFSSCQEGSDMPYIGHKGWGSDEQDAPAVTRQVVSLQVTGHNSKGGYKHNKGSDSDQLLYVDHAITEEKNGKLLRINMEDGELQVAYFMQFYNNAAAVRTWSEVKNRGSEDIGIDYISSFIYEGLGKNGNKSYFEKMEIYVPRNSWANEAQWNKYSAQSLGLSFMPVEGYQLPDSSNNRFHYGNMGSWSTCEYLPMGMIRDQETGEIFYSEIDFSGSWSIEYGSTKDKNMYIALMGPDDESMWWKNLKAGEKFSTVPAVFGVCIGDESAAVSELTKYRRAIRRPNVDDDNCYVIFNDYMNCLFGDPTEEKEKQIIDIAANLGCEYYCMDCGWYAKGFWWDTIGEWIESKDRFPNGMKTVYEYARSKGLKMGMWLEIEAMGTSCDLASKLPDSWFICNHGQRRIENSRYLLDFRNPEVRKYCTDVVERLIRDYGCEYFKVDYNVTTGPGADTDADSRGQALLDHYRALYQWYREIYERHPNLIIENCGSGAQRMDYGILQLHSLQSTSDQTDYISNSYIASNVAAAVTPEQAGMWVYPYKDDAEHVIYNMVNGLLLRPYISGIVWNLSKDNLNLFAEGIQVYKDIRDDIRTMTPFFPQGFNLRNAKALFYGMRNESKTYLSVFGPDTDNLEVPLGSDGKQIKYVKVLYPKGDNCDFQVENDVLEVKMPGNKCARLFMIQY